MAKVLLVTPPFTQLNAPYPAVPCLTRTLRTAGHDTVQADLGLESALRLFSRDGLLKLFASARASRVPPGSRLAWAFEMAERYLDTIEPVVRFLQGRDPTLAHRVCHARFLPEGPRFDRLQDESWAFGTLGVTDRARFLCTLYLEDLADLVTELLVPEYRFSRYGESLALAATDFAVMAKVLAQPGNFVDELAAGVMEALLDRHRPQVVGFTVPFPGTLLGALRAAQVVRRWDPRTRVVLGGGFVNTELRDLRAPALFDIVDFVTLDDGEEPMIAMLEHLEGARGAGALCRTFVRDGSSVRFIAGDRPPDLSGVPRGFPSFDGLPLDGYLSVLELLNPTHRLWSDGRWNRMPLAHGCYWKRCAFCDVTLPHVADFRPGRARDIVDRMEHIVAETGQSGFHFVDEAAPPALLRAMALEILERGLVVSWWGNVRFEEAFTPDLCRLLAASGCIAVSGGLEIASDRLLKRMRKGVTVAQVARAAAAFTGASIMVHAYLMYGFPSQTEQEIVDSLERVRQLFDEGLIQSGFWHRFYATAHAPVGRCPAEFGITITGPERGDFAWNDLEYVDAAGCDADAYGPALDTALYHFMHGQGLDRDVRSWFDRRVPRPNVPKSEVRRAVAGLRTMSSGAPGSCRLVWLGGRADIAPAPASSRTGKEILQVAAAGGVRTFRLPGPQARWLKACLDRSRPRGRGGKPYPTVEEVAERHPGGPAAFASFIARQTWRAVREDGLLLVPSSR